MGAYIANQLGGLAENYYFGIRRYLYSTNLSVNPLTFRELVMDGMKLSPPNPNFVEARDGILLADQVSNSGANDREIWTSFARRGLGYSAGAPGSSTTAGVTESFDLPDDLRITPKQGFLPLLSVGTVALTERAAASEDGRSSLNRYGAERSAR